MLSLRWELSACLKWWTNPMSPNLDVGPWTLNCWMSSSTELAPCHSMESFCHAIASQFGSANTRSTSASNLSIIIGIPEGLRTCQILCVVGRIVPCILHCSFYMILYHKHHTKMCTTGILEIGKGITLSSNKTSSCG